MREHGFSTARSFSDSLIAVMKKNRRAPWHDYTQPGYYHLTLNKAAGVSPFSEVIAMGIRQATVRYTPLGKAIRDTLGALKEIDPALELLQYIIMPDHIHLLVHVADNLDDILGRKIAVFKVRTNRAAGVETIFSAGFHDRIISRKHNLNTVFNYIRENPRRLIARRQFPEYFSRVNNLTVCGHKVQAYGNLLLRDKPFGDREKPLGEDFELCSLGRMLILVPADEGFEAKSFRDKCLSMNYISEEIARSARG